MVYMRNYLLGNNVTKSSVNSVFYKRLLAPEYIVKFYIYASQ